jgi:hypothetical protein
MRIHAFIEQRLPDPGLSPATIAAAHHHFRALSLQAVRNAADHGRGLDPAPPPGALPP